jgi:hypothetical protein
MDTKRQWNTKDPDLKHDTNIHNSDLHKPSYNIPYTRNVDSNRREGWDNNKKLVLLFEALRSSLIKYTVFCALNVAGTS